MAKPAKAAKGRSRIKRGPGKRMVDGKSFRLADEVRYIQRRAAEHDSRIVSIGQVVLFSSESGDAWMLEPSEYLAVRLASDGHPEPIHIEDTETTFTVAWTGQCRIMGPAFLYTDQQASRHNVRLPNAKACSDRSDRRGLERLCAPISEPSPR
jgi:hypothetical protein